MMHFEMRRGRSEVREGGPFCDVSRLPWLAFHRRSCLLHALVAQHGWSLLVCPPRARADIARRAAQFDPGRRVLALLGDRLGHARPVRTAGHRHPAHLGNRCNLVLGIDCRIAADADLRSARSLFERTRPSEWYGHDRHVGHRRACRDASARRRLDRRRIRDRPRRRSYGLDGAPYISACRLTQAELIRRRYCFRLDAARRARPPLPLRRRFRSPASRTFLRPQPR